MRIYKTKLYEVVKYTETEALEYGVLSGSDVQSILKNTKYDKEYGMYYNSNHTFAYNVVEVRR